MANMELGEPKYITSTMLQGPLPEPQPPLRPEEFLCSNWPVGLDGRMGYAAAQHSAWPCLAPPLLPWVAEAPRKLAPPPALDVPPGIWLPRAAPQPTSTASTSASERSSSEGPPTSVPGDAGPLRCVRRCDDGSPGGASEEWEWTVCRKLTSRDTCVVSPELTVDLPGAGPTRFIMMLLPSLPRNEKGKGGFRAARGKVSIELKCRGPDRAAEGPLLVQFQVAVGRHPLRAPVVHDFAERTCRGLGQKDRAWTVGQADSFVVRLVLGPAEAAEEEKSL